MGVCLAHWVNISSTGCSTVRLHRKVRPSPLLPLPHSHLSPHLENSRDSINASCRQPEYSQGPMCVLAVLLPRYVACSWHGRIPSTLVGQGVWGGGLPEHGVSQKQQCQGIQRSSKVPHGHSKMAMAAKGHVSSHYSLSILAVVTGRSTLLSKEHRAQWGLLLIS